MDVEEECTNIFLSSISEKSFSADKRFDMDYSFQRFLYDESIDSIVIDVNKCFHALGVKHEVNNLRKIGIKK